MKVNINKPPKHIKAAEERKKRREWHQTFAWTPKKVDKTDAGHSVVWFEKYTRRQQIGPTNAKSKDDGLYWEQYSNKEFFRKKLAGDFKERVEEDAILVSGGTTTITNIAAGSGLYYNTTGDTGWVSSGGTATVFKDSDSQWFINGKAINDNAYQFEFEYDIQEGEDT